MRFSIRSIADTGLAHASDPPLRCRHWPVRSATFQASRSSTEVLRFQHPFERLERSKLLYQVFGLQRPGLACTGRAAGNGGTGVGGAKQGKTESCTAERFRLALSRLLLGSGELGGNEGGGAFAQEGADAEENGSGGDDKEGDADQGAVDEPGEGNGAEAEGKGGDKGEETDAGAGDAAEEGDDVGDHGEGLRNEGNADDHHDKAHKANDPGEDCVRLPLGGKHVGGTDGALLEELDAAAAATDLVWLEGASGLSGNDAYGAEVYDLKGDLGVADCWFLRVLSEVKAIVDGGDGGGEVGGELGLRVLGHGEEVKGVDHADEAFRQSKVADAEAGRDESAAFDRHLAGVFVAVGLFESAGIDEGGVPAFLVGVGGDGFLAATEGFFSLGLFVLGPLIHLDIAAEFDSVGGDAKGGIAGRAAGGGVAVEMDELAIIGGVERSGGDSDDGVETGVEGAGTVDGVAFVPDEEREGADEKDDAEDDTGNGAADPAEP